MNALKQVSYQASWLAQAKRNISNRKGGKQVNTDVEYQNLISDKGKRSTNASLNLSSAGPTIAPQELVKINKNKNMSFRVSNLISPRQKMNHVEKNRKNLCDYQKEKRSQPSSNGVVIVMKNKSDNKSNKNGNLLAKYLRTQNQAAQGVQSSRVSKNSRKSAKKSSGIPISSPSTSSKKYSISGKYKKEAFMKEGKISENYSK